MKISEIYWSKARRRTGAAAEHRENSGNLSPRLRNWFVRMEKTTKCGVLQPLNDRPMGLSSVTQPPEGTLIRMMEDNQDTEIDYWDVTGDDRRSHDFEAGGRRIKINNDYHDRRTRNGDPVALLVADASGDGAEPGHPYWHLPHIRGMLVAEEHRNQGIGTDMVEGLLDRTERKRFVVDCRDAVKPFFEQIAGAKAIYPEWFKNGRKTPEEYKNPEFSREQNV